MALIIEDDEVDRLARALAQATGETLTEAIVIGARGTPGARAGTPHPASRCGSDG